MKLKDDDSLFMIGDFISDGIFLIKNYLLDSFPSNLLPYVSNTP